MSHVLGPGAHNILTASVLLSSARDTRTTKPAFCLSPFQVAATGEEALEKLEELEMIFGAVDELGGLERCTSLRSLTRERCNDRRATFVVHGPHERFSSRPLTPFCP